MSSTPLSSWLAGALLAAQIAMAPIARPILAEQMRCEVPIVLPPRATGLQRLAAQELAEYLGRIYPQIRFTVICTPPQAAQVIRVGAVESDPSLRDYLNPDQVKGPESFAVTVVKEDGSQTAVIAGSAPPGTLYGVYALLKKLGCGFYLSYEVVPSATEPFSFDRWELADAPLVPVRIVFNWHNFLSGCSTWNLRHWQSWILAAQKAGYNGIMVHAYGNNPMFCFDFAGRTKPVGYLSTTVKGRDWSTQHVNDVRRLWGGEVFDSPVFGPHAALVPDAERVDAARNLMNRVFASAENRGMDVYFAVDVDTVSANPQSLIETLPTEARFAITVQAMRRMNQQGGKMWLANPDTPAGYEYYKAQVEALLSGYPQIDCLVVWFRHNATPWMAFAASEMPAAWQREYRAELERTPEAAKLWRAHNFFALGKIVAAFDRALGELGRDDVELAIGSWRFDFFPPADRFLAGRVKFIPLDYEVLHDRSQMDTAERRAAIAAVGARRPVIPVVWAHHDDGNYVGRPYKPYAAFYDKLLDAKASGFGIIHWTTRPLDLYFASLAEQVWQRTRNRPLRETCEEMADRSFGRPNRQVMGEYLNRWVTEAAKIGRETGDRFIDRPLPRPDSMAAAREQRARLLDQAVRNTDCPSQLARIEYYRGLEQYVVDVCRTEAAFNEAKALWTSGDLAAARRAMAACRPGDVIQRYARFSSLAGITRGEQGLVVSMNLRWLTHYARFRQMLGLEPVRYNFAPTSHDLLAQSRGTFTFHFQPDRSIWQCLGQQETGGSTFVVPDSVPVARGQRAPASWEEVFRTGIESAEPITIPMQPMLARGGRGLDNAAPLPPGKYRLRLLMLDPTSTGPGQRVFKVSVRKPGESSVYRFEPVKARYLRLVCHGNSENDWNSIHEIEIPSLDYQEGSGVASASGAKPGYPAGCVVDGRTDTRWAAQGDGQWIQFRLNSDVPTDTVKIAWYQRQRRKYRFELLLSHDGRSWSNVEVLDRPSETVWERVVDIFREAGGRNRGLELAYPIELARAGRVDVTLTPLQGKALVCGAVVEPLSE